MQHLAIDRGAARPEYQALVDGYPALLRPFGIELAAQDLADLAILIAAVEQVDRVLDAEPLAASRSAFARSVLDQLDRPADRPVDRPADPALEPIARSVRTLRQLAIRRGILRELAALTAETLANSEQIRIARDRGRYLACVEREGSLCNELALLVVPLPAAPAAFLRAIAPAANLMDKLIDVRGDRRRGEVAIDPGMRTHALLAGRLVARAWTASRLHPDRAGFVRWGVGWLRRMAAT